MKRIACQYAVIRFLPFVETGEFANVGVVLMAPDVAYFDFRLELKKTRRVTQFFHELDAPLYRAALREFDQELARVRDLVHDANVPAQQRRQLGQTLFNELTRKRGNLVQFSNVRAVLSKDFMHEVDRLFQYYVKRNFSSQQQREQQLEQRLRSMLQSASLADRFHARKLGPEDFSVQFPFVQSEGDHHLKAIKPLDFTQEQPKLILEKAAKWEFRVHRLRHLERLPERLLFATRGPARKDRSRFSAFAEAQEMLAGTNAAVILADEREKLLEFARAG
ncbi:MAG: DUF3037 domain-containing protein [Pseudomonadota bacterium]|nr:MAG: DUF3037 domain-containing protein [Pseudomonadota bacterium]